MHNYQNNYLIAPEVSNEFNLLNEFLNSSLLDDGVLSGDQNQVLKNDNDMLPGGYLGQNTNPLLPPSALPSPGGAGMQQHQQQQHQQQQQQHQQQHQQQQQQQQLAHDAAEGPSVTNLATTTEDKKRREVAEFYLNIADPSGNDTPEARMERVLRAKYEAGVLKPFNYILGYKRLQDYLDTHIQPSSKQKILTQIGRFRPKFREKVKHMSDIQLVFVEMWFEKTLMEYDRVFASMAVPACCWRRTGEIFRGNKEMAELIGVEVEDLRDVSIAALVACSFLLTRIFLTSDGCFQGKIALHQILTETSMVRYWEEFGTIAFDPQHDTLLTACELKAPAEDETATKEIKCCFSLKIRRDNFQM